MKLLFSMLMLALTTYVFAATALIGLPADKLPLKDSVFLKTHWKQMGGFEADCPDHMRLGCWSTALAQLMYYHRLQPFGRVSYTSRKGFFINEDLSRHHVDLRLLTLQIDSTTTPETKKALADYNYAAALAVEKDFGTDSYMHKLAPAGLFERHYAVDVSRYISWKHLLPYASGKLEKVIRSEIRQRRPLFLHFANLRNFGHSVIIDGYKETGQRFLVHLNQGQGGSQDGWYDFDQDLLIAGDRNLRVLYTFKPIK